MSSASTSVLLRCEEVRLKFLAQWLEDRERGVERSLDAYLELFPGCEAVIREEFLEHAAGNETRIEKSPGDLAPGDILGRYRVLSEIGRGGQGRVYLAQDEELKRKVALKVFDFPAGLSFERRRRFQRESELASRLDHPSLGTVYEARVEGHRAYIAMRFVEGESLAAKIEAARCAGRRSCALDTAAPERDLERTVALAVEHVARALQKAHEAGVVHRDVKPGNVMIDPSGAPVLVDFGLARGLEDDALNLTRSGELLGTPAYMSPEQISGDAPVDARSDVYSLGLVLFECLTLQRPFASPTAEGLRTQILTQAPPDARSFAPRIPRDLATILAFALEKDRARRYATAFDLAEDLRRWREGSPLSVRPPSVFARARMWSRRRPAAAALALVLALGVPLLVGLVGFLLARWPALRAIEEQERRERIERALEDGYFAFEEGTAESARAHFRRARDEDPQALEATLGLALGELWSRRPLVALELLDGYGTPMPLAAEQLRAQALIELGRHDEALAIDARVGEPRSDLECFVAGEREIFRGESGDRSAWPRALSAFGRAIERSPRPRALYLARCAAAAYRARDAATAVRCADLLELHWPESPTATFFAAFALSEVEPLRSLPYFERAIAVRPSEGRYHFNYGNALRAAGRPEEAERAYRRAIELRPANPGPMINLGNLLTERHQLDEALELYDLAVRVGSDRADVHYNRGYCLQCLERFDEALDAYGRAIEIAPHHTTAQANLSGLLMRLGRHQDALAALQRAISADPSDGELHVNLGAVLELLGREAEAIAATRRGTELRPDSIHAWKNLALQLEASGVDGEGTLPVWREVIRITPEWAQAHYRAAFAMRRAGSFADALAGMQRAGQLERSDSRFADSVGEQIADLERLVELERTLVQRLGAQASAATSDDAVWLAEICAARELFQTSAELYEQAFGRAPELEIEHQFDAACAALEAGLATGELALRESTAARARWRDRARRWLEADLTRIEAALRENDIDPAVARRRLGSWQHRLRPLEGAAGGEVDAAERAAWAALLQRRDALLAEVRR